MKVAWKKPTLLAVAAVAALSIAFITPGNAPDEGPGPFQRMLQHLSEIAGLVAPIPTIEEFTAASGAQQEKILIALAERDPDAAWNLLQKAGVQAGFSGLPAHQYGHIVGEGLYRAHGIAGITHCGPGFGLACYHGVTIGLTKEKKNLNVSELVAECRNAFATEIPGGSIGFIRGCIHGIGHGLALTENIDPMRALARCEEIDEQHVVVDPTLDVYISDRTACAEGMFMEVLVGDAHVNWDTDTVWNFCGSLSEAYARACVRFFPLKFEGAGGPIRSVEDLLAFCESAPARSLQYGCFSESSLIGLAAGGRETFTSLRDHADAMLISCLTVIDQDYRARCVNVIAGFYIFHRRLVEPNQMQETDAELLSVAEEMCSKLEEPYRGRCKARSEFTIPYLSVPVL